MRRYIGIAAVLPAILAFAACGGNGGQPSSTSPDGPSASTVANPDLVGELRSRPLRLPRLRTGQRCPLTRPSALPVRRVLGPALGSGPVRPIIENGDIPFARVGATMLRGVLPNRLLLQKVPWVASPGFRGPTIVRGRQLDGPHALFFVQSGGGSLLTVRRLALDQAGTGGNGWARWNGYTLVGAPGCYGYQVDGKSFSYAVVFRARGS